MKRLFTILAMVAFWHTSFAYDFSATAPSGQTLYYNIVNGHAEVVQPGSNYVTGNLIIPASVSYNSNTYTVTSIGESVFNNCTGLTSVTIPNSITSIGDGAFQYCSGLTSVTIPNSVTRIGNHAFLNCTGLTSITIPNSVTSIGNQAFCNCTGLTSVVFNADSCTSGASSSNSALFRGCLNINSFVFGNNVKVIPAYLFYGMDSLSLTSVTIPDSVTSIGRNAFTDCTWLTSLTIGGSVTSIERYAFSGCSRLTEINISALVAPQLGLDAFSNVTSTIPVNIPCGSSMSYYSRWSYFSGFIEATVSTLSVQSANTAMGTVSILTQPTCQVTTAVLHAVANNGFQFSHWSDNNTDNPRSLQLTQDTSITAYFVPAAHDTVFIHDTVTIIDTVLYQYQQYDTTIVNIYDTIINNYYRYDTTIVYDTTIINTYDTTLVNIYDTIINNLYQYDTTIVNVYDTTIINVYDTTINNNYVYDTIIVNNYVYDTVIVNHHTYDTVNNYYHDTVNNYYYDTVIITHYYHDTVIINNYIYDTIYLNRYIFDTIYIHDTIYVGGNAIGDVKTIDARIYARDGQIVVEGAEGMPVMLYDAVGRLLVTRREEAHGGTPLRFDVPTSGVYLVKVGDWPARRIVMLR